MTIQLKGYTVDILKGEDGFEVPYFSRSYTTLFGAKMAVISFLKNKPKNVWE